MIMFKDISIYPYRVIDGIASIPNSFFISVFNQMKNEGFADEFFLSIDLNNYTEADFVRWCKSVSFYFVEHDQKPGMLVWVKSIKEGFGSVDYYCFKSTWGKTAAHITKTMLEWLLTNEWYTLIGFSPTSNEYGLKFLEKIEMNKVGVIPDSKYYFKGNTMVNTVISYKTREEYLGER